MTDRRFRNATYPMSIEDKDELAQEFAEFGYREPSTRTTLIAAISTRWTVLKTWSIGSISDSIGLDGFGAKACGASQGFSISMIG
jgi:hypothetical protein